MMEGIDNTAGTSRMKNHENLNTGKEGKANVIDYNKKIDNDKAVIGDCIHMNVGEDMDGRESVGSNVDEDIAEVSKTNVQIHNETVLSPLVWPDNVELYQPFDKQMLFSEMPNCLYVEAFLRMCNLQYTLVQKSNAESIGPSGEVPVLRCGKFIVSGADKIIKFIESKGTSLTNSFTESQKGEMNFYMSLVRMTLANAEDNITWLDYETYRKVTQSKFCSIYPWPLSWYLMQQKKQRIQNKLDATGWGCKTIDDVCEEIKQCYKALADKLQACYFFGYPPYQPTNLDALVFAHAYTIMTYPLPKSQFAGLIVEYPILVEHCYRVLESYFKELNTSNLFAELHKALI